MSEYFNLFVPMPIPPCQNVTENMKRIRRGNMKKKFVRLWIIFTLGILYRWRHGPDSDHSVQENCIIKCWQDQSIPLACAEAKVHFKFCFILYYNMWFVLFVYNFCNPVRVQLCCIVDSLFDDYKYNIKIIKFAQLFNRFTPILCV